MVRQIHGSQMDNGKNSQWQDQSWDDWSWYESEESYAAKGKGKFGKIERMESPDTMDKPNLQILPRAAPQLPRLSYTFFIEHIHVFNFSFMATEGNIDKIDEAFIFQPLTPTAMVLDLGCTRAMARRVAAQDLMKYCDQNPNCVAYGTP